MINIRINCFITNLFIFNILFMLKEDLIMNLNYNKKILVQLFNFFYFSLLFLHHNYVYNLDN